MPLAFLRRFRDEGRSRYYRRSPDGAVLIELKLNHIEQLFDSFDPAPFFERGLDRAAEAYIVGAVRELPLHLPLTLAVYLPPKQLAELDLAQLKSAIHGYFRYRLEARRADLRSLLRSGQFSLLAGFAVLIGSNALSELILASGPGAFGRFLGEGLSILGWVAMWRPMDILVFEPWPIVRDCRRLERLTEISVEAHPAP